MASTKKYPALKQSTQALQQSAELANVATQATGRVPLVSSGKINTVAPKSNPARSSNLWISIFFDGTGNNLKADLETGEHSNVARLYRAHEHLDSERGYYPIYVPGLGTLFPEINDPGGAYGNGFGGRGEDRLSWAMTQLKSILKDAAKSSSRLNVALFGFSRGAALARAFARRLANLSEQKGDEWRLKASGRPIELYFMGLFDTVASVGLAASANNGGALGQLSTKAAVASRYAPSAANSSAPFFIALGPQPGANPTAGLSNGHGAWADDLRIPARHHEPRVKPRRVGRGSVVRARSSEVRARRRVTSGTGSRPTTATRATCSPAGHQPDGRRLSGRSPVSSHDGP